jgi:hypothetical protein
MLDGADDRRRDDIGGYSGAARRIGDEQVQRVLVMSLETTPADATHWSTRSLAKQVEMSQSAISRIGAGVRAQAAPGRHLQAVGRPAVHR